MPLVPIEPLALTVWAVICSIWGVCMTVAPRSGLVLVAVKVVPAVALGS